MDIDNSPVARISNDFLDYQYDVLGILEYMSSSDVTEICINKPGELYLEKRDGWHRIEVPALNFERARQFCTAVVNESNTGQRITDTDPVVSLTFPTGQRAQFVIPPACDAGKVSITIRLPSKQTRTLHEYQQDGFFDQILEQTNALSDHDRELLELRYSRNYAEFFRKAVLYKKNIVVSGATGSGKTTLLNLLSGFIPANERIITIEDAAELQMRQPHVVRLETRPPNIEGKGEVPQRALVRNALRMRPDRIILGEVRGAEALDMLQAMNTGHEGSLTTLHANTPRDGLARLETMVLMAGMDLPLVAIREQIASAVHIVVQQTRFACGSRKVTSITEISGMESG